MTTSTRHSGPHVPTRPLSMPAPGGDQPPRGDDARRRPPGHAARAANLWARRLHVYTSMVALLVVLFFAITGITLNHPTWTFGDEVDVQTVTGALPAGSVDDAGAVSFLTIAEFARAEHGVSGTVSSFEAADGRGSIAFTKPGYSADLLFDLDAGTYELTVTQQGFVAVMNDLHKGRDAGSPWRWAIDLSAGFLAVISATGLVLQLFLHRRRTAALVTAAAGGAVVVALMVITLW